MAAVHTNARAHRAAPLAVAIYVLLAFLPPLAGADLSAGRPALAPASAQSSPTANAPAPEAAAVAGEEAQEAEEAEEGAGEEDTVVSAPLARRAAPASSVQSGPIIGTNDGAGWGPEASAMIMQAHITWNRVELGGSHSNNM